MPFCQPRQIAEARRQDDLTGHVHFGLSTKTKKAGARQDRNFYSFEDTFMRKKKLLNEAQIDKIPPGRRHALGGPVAGFSLRKKDWTSGQYVQRYIDPATGANTEITLCPFPLYTTLEALEKARNVMRDVWEGHSPESRTKKNRRLRREQKQRILLKDAVAEWIDFMAKDGAWATDSRSPRDIGSYFKNYIFPALGNKKLSTITISQIADCLRPIWVEKHPTALKVRIYLERVFSWCIATDRCPKLANPATKEKLFPLLGHLDSKVNSGENFAACDIREIPRLCRELFSLETTAAWACLFAIYTAARSKAVRNAKWTDINFEKRIWRIPATNDKKKEHLRNRNIYLSDAAVDLLHRQQLNSSSEYVFANRAGEVLTDAALLKILRTLHNRRFAEDGVGWVDPQKIDLDCKDVRITLHGTARASFRTWCEEKEFDGKFCFNVKAIELNLLHQPRDLYRGAYSRSTMIEERQRIMNLWGKYCRSAIHK